MVICKDMGPTNMVAPIAQVLSEQGHEVFPVLEGMGARLWPAMCAVPPVFRGTDDYATIPFSLEIGPVLDHCRPDVVIVGTSFPNHLEGRFIRAAQQRDIPRVVVEDFWGGFRRLGLLRPPNLVLTLDEYSSELIRQQFGSEPRVTIVGNPGVKFRYADPAPEIMAMRTRGDLVITLCGGGYETAEQIQLLIECLNVTRKRWKLIPRWHPKEANRPDPENNNRPYRETWDALLEQLGDQVVRVDGPSTESVVVASNMVCAGYSTLLSTAAYAGVVAVSLATPKVMQALGEESPLDQIPQVGLEVAHQVTSHVDLAQLQPCPAEARARLIPFDPTVGAAAVCDLLEGVHA